MKKILFSLLMLCSMTAAWAQDATLPKDVDGYYLVSTLKQFQDAVKNNLSKDGVKSYSNIRLAKNLILSEYSHGTFNNTFCGVLDGNGYSIIGTLVPGRYYTTYLFTHSEGAIFKDLTFKDIHVNNNDYSNQCIITSQAKNNCIFRNITFDNCGAWSNYNNVGAAAGYAYDCIFSNIKVKNSDFTVDDNYVGSVVGDADKCSFTDIEVTNSNTYASDICAGGVVGHSRNCTFTGVTVRDSNFKTGKTQSGAIAGHAVDNSTFTDIIVANCEINTDGGKSGGVAGSTDNCTIDNVEILGTFVKTNSQYGGGVVGYSEHTAITNCVFDDQSCVWVYGGALIDGYAGGIAGYAQEQQINHCINSGLITCDDNVAGGIVGCYKGEGRIDDCLNTGMIVSIGKDKVNDYYLKYKNKELSCVTKYYGGKEYVVRKTELPNTGDDYYGGIVGKAFSALIEGCANIGSMNGTDSSGGIVGRFEGHWIDCCLCDFECPSDKVMGLVGDSEDYGVYENCSMALCVNMSPAENFYGSMNLRYIFSYSNNSFDNNELNTGEICYQLGEDVWEQNIGTDAYPTPTGGKGVYHTRKVSNQYGTACLPFSVKSDDKISYYQFTEATEGDDIKLKFTYAEDLIPAGTPVLFRAAEAEYANANNPVEICFKNAGDVFDFNTHGRQGNSWEMCGTFMLKFFNESTPVSSKNIYYVSGGEIRNAKMATIAPYRAYFLGPSIDELTANNAQQAKAIRFVLQDEDGSTADLQLVGNDLVPVQRDGKVYTIMGTEANKNYRGIVIKNGRKTLTPALSL